MIKRRFIGLALLAGSVLPLLAQDVTIDSPDEKLKLTVSCPAGGGSVSYSIVYDGRQMLESSPLGMETNIGNFSDGMKWSGHDVRKIDTVYNQSRIKTSRVHYQANELACEFASAEGQKIGVTFRVGNNDVAFRYTLPRQNGKGSVVVNKEQTGFHFPPQTTTFLCPQSDAMIGWKRTKPSYEEEYRVDAPMN